ncbi:MAG: hypothetical protein EPO24_14210, partial [Bacteroidetes bacterium]
MKYIGYILAGACYCMCLTCSLMAQWSVDQYTNTVVSNASGTQKTPVMIDDGAGGAIIAWSDNRNGNYDIYAQRLNAEGIAQWAANGIVLCNATSKIGR